MFYIDPQTPELVKAEAHHFNRFKCYVNKKIRGNSCADPTCNICASGLHKVKNLKDKIRDFLIDPFNLEVILRGTPSDLLEINYEFWASIFPAYNEKAWRPFFDRKNITDKSKSPHKGFSLILFEYIDQLEKIFDYTGFCKTNDYYTAYQLSSALNRSTCTYCNRTYTSTITEPETGKPIIRPTFDHWFPQSKYPLLAVSFFNLIPSCYHCNSSVKGADPFNLKDHTHPYVDISQNDDFEFGYIYLTKLNKYRILLKDTDTLRSKSRKTLEQLSINDIYDAHQGELNDLITIRKNYSQSYIKTIQNLLGGKLSNSEVYKILFGVELQKKDFYKRPLSKFKYDILKQLGILDGI
ncbi:MAG: hypothetical protein ACTHNW_06635 [Mucilaginibacter sp.]